MQPNVRKEPSPDFSLGASKMEKVSTEIKVENRALRTGTTRPSGRQN